MERVKANYWPCIIVGIMLISVACGSERHDKRHDRQPTRHPKSAEKTGLSEWDQLGWIDKTARILRNGKGLGPDDDAEALLKMSRAEVVDQFMAGRDFTDTVFHFNLYFLGFYQTPSDYEPGSGVDAEASFYPSAIASAKAVTAGGDYLTLFDYKQDLALGQSFVSSEESEEIRSIFADRINKLAMLYKQDDKDAFCAAFIFDELAEAAFALGTEFANVLISPAYIGKIASYCDGSVGDLDGHFDAILAKFDIFLKISVETHYDVYEPKHVDEIKVIAPEEYGLQDETPFTTSGFWFLNPNSSTNYNRSRAAYILERFFCDDLTPINVETPDSHTDDRHASDPACQSCHYKLDPMAGFFKDHGVFGQDFSSSAEIVFDDGVKVNRDDYQSIWRQDDGERDWNIGYVRSVNDPEMNDYGHDLEDLFSIAKSAPEVKACLTQRMFEFFAGGQQAIDKGYLAHLQKAFDAQPVKASGSAFKKVVKDIVLSKTFAQKDPISTACYDYAPGVDPAGRPPCEMAYLLDKNCAACHGDNAPAGGLNLTGWTTLASGAKSFPHVDAQGRQVDKMTTFNAMLTALESTDPAVRMPMNQHMSAQDREELYLWINDVLSHGEEQ